MGIGISELLVILVIAIIFVGPQRLPQLVNWLAKGLAEFKKEADELRDTIMEAPDISTSAKSPSPEKSTNPSETTRENKIGLP